MLLVEPLSLVKIKSSARLVHFVEIEGRHEFLQGENFLVGTGVPAQEGQHVDKSLGVEAALAVARSSFAGLFVVPVQRENGEAEAVAVTLGQFAVAIGTQEEGEVCKFGLFPLKKAVEQHVQRSRGQPFFAADHVGDVHGVVIDDVGQVVGGHAVALEEDFVVQVQGVDAYPAADAVFKFYFLIAGHFDPNDIGLAGVQTTLHLFFGKGERIFHGRTGDAVVLPVGVSSLFGAFAHGL